MKNKVSNIVRAISIIGLNNAKRIVFSISVKSLFDSHVIFDKLLWEHALGVAIIAQTLSYKYGLFDENRSYIAGLLHDIGKIVMSKDKQINYKLVEGKVSLSDSIASYQIETEIYGFNHCDIGYQILSLWNFDDIFAQAIYLHHNNEFTENKSNRLAALINFSDYVANWLSIGRLKPYRQISLTDLESYKFLQLSINDDIQSFLQKIKEKVDLLSCCIT